MKLRILAAWLCVTSCTLAGEAAPPVPHTLMTKCGELLVNEDFAQPPPPFEGKPVGFASGFQGWRYSQKQGKAGIWEVAHGSLKGTENPAAMHPATASCGFLFKDVVIACEVKMDDVPLDGRRGRYIDLRTTDDKEYVCSIHLRPGGFLIRKNDHDHAGPDQHEQLGFAKAPIEAGQWIPVVMEIMGDEMVGTVNNISLTGRHPLIDQQKHSIMFVIGNVGEVRNFRAWKALPNPDWPENKAKLSPTKEPRTQEQPHRTRKSADEKVEK